MGQYILACILLPAEVLNMLAEAYWVSKYSFQP